MANLARFVQMRCSNHSVLDSRMKLKKIILGYKWQKQRTKSKNKQYEKNTQIRRDSHNKGIPEEAQQNDEGRKSTVYQLIFESVCTWFLVLMRMIMMKMVSYS